MKHLLTTVLFVISLIEFSYSQESKCKVLKPEIAVSYSGDCKKGLANGKGIAEGIDKYDGKFKDGLPHGNGRYTYSNGDIYEGDFKYGKKDGNGKFSFKYLGKDSTYLGIWKADNFVRKVIPPAYIITQKYNAQRFTVVNENQGNRIMFAFMQNGMHNYSVTGLTFATSSGTPFSLGQDQGFDNILFPFNCKVTYTTANSFRSSSYDVIFEIQINEPGQWMITISN